MGALPESTEPLLIVSMSFAWSSLWMFSIVLIDVFGISRCVVALLY